MWVGKGLLEDEVHLGGKAVHYFFDFHQQQTSFIYRKKDYLTPLRFYLEEDNFLKSLVPQELIAIFAVVKLIMCSPSHSNRFLILTLSLV